MTTLLGTEVHAPAALVQPTPAAPPFVSLLTSARVDETTDGEWINGVAYLPENICTTPLLPFWWACPEEGHATPGGPE